VVDCSPVAGTNRLSNTELWPNTVLASSDLPSRALPLFKSDGLRSEDMVRRLKKGGCGVGSTREIA
jgi:hypothetical protein